MLYLPGATLLRIEDQRTRDSTSAEVQVYDIKLWLPCKIRQRIMCDQYLQEVEWVLREAQAKDALDTIRQHLRLDSFLTKRKKNWARGVKANTRSLTTIEQNRWRMRAAVERYRAAYNALDILAPMLRKSNQWKNSLQVLRDEDIVGLPVNCLEVGEGRRTLSWIWMAPGVLNSTENPDDDPRLHDSKSTIDSDEYFDLLSCSPSYSMVSCTSPKDEVV